MSSKAIPEGLRSYASKASVLFWGPYYPGKYLIHSWFIVVMYFNNMPLLIFKIPTSLDCELSKYYIPGISSKPADSRHLINTFA